MTNIESVINRRMRKTSSIVLGITSAVAISFLGNGIGGCNDEDQQTTQNYVQDNENDNTSQVTRSGGVIYRPWIYHPIYGYQSPGSPLYNHAVAGGRSHGSVAENHHGAASKSTPAPKGSGTTKGGFGSIGKGTSGGS